MTPTPTPARLPVPFPVPPDALRELARLARLDEYGLVPGHPVLPGGHTRLHLDLENLTDLARRVTGAPLAMVNIIDAHHQHALATQGFESLMCDRADSMCAAVFQLSGPTVVPDAQLDPRFAANPYVSGVIDQLRFYAAVPLITPGGHSIGTLCVTGHEPRSLDDDQVQALEALAGQVVDVVELHRRTLQLDEAVQQLVRSNTALAEFAGRVSHDLQAPLNSIVGFAEILTHSRPLADDIESRRYLERIEAAGSRMHRMIKDLLAYAVAGAAPHLVDVELTPLVDDVLKDLDSGIRAAGAIVTVDVGDVRGDPEQLRALVQNLVQNSLNYRRPDVPCRVSVVSAETGHGWLLRVIDNGQGIPADQREHVRRPMSRMQRDRITPGTGIGLATCERIATAHEGTLEIDGNPGGGTVVTLRVEQLPEESE